MWSATAGAAVAPLPIAPDNLVVFPDRDFVTIEGFADRINQEATIEVERVGVGVVGSAKGVVSGTDVAFEINHPGGYCWGAGTNLKVTPDILPGDVVSISFGGVKVAATTVQDARAGNSFIDLAADSSGATMKVVGHIATTIDPANFEQRIIEPALVDTPVARRDIRALIGPMEPAPRGGYSSGVEVVGDVFTATYVFDDPAVAAIAAGATGERAMTWELTDPAANRQGLTIAEFGELGGPGMGGCPNGPLQTGPAGPTNVAAALVSGGTAVNVNWTPAVTVPGTLEITGYRISAVDNADATAIGTELVEVGRRITGRLVDHTTITGLDPNITYRVEVASVSAAGLTFPAVNATVATDGTAPHVTAAPAGGSYSVAQQVTLTADEPGVDIYYTTSGLDPVDNAGGAQPGATLYSGPIAITVSTPLKFAGFDPSGNVSAIATEAYAITDDPVAGATTITSAAPGLAQVTLQWAGADPGAPQFNIAGYRVRAYTTVDGTTPAAEVVLNGGGTNTTVTPLASDVNYWFTVAAINDVPGTVYGPESPRFGPVAPLGAVVANAGPDQTNVPRGSVVRLSGAGSTLGGTYLWTQMSNGGTTPMGAGDVDRVSLIGANTLSPSFTAPLITGLRSNGPLYFQLSVTTSQGTKLDMVTIVPRNDTISIGTARWKQGDFRISGTGTVDGASITVRNSAGAPLGTAPVVAGAWTLRIRTGVADPIQIMATSNNGGTTGLVATTR
jgi:hypothetical protein